MRVAGFFVDVLAANGLAGAVFAVAEHAPLGLRLIVMPGAAALWPLRRPIFRREGWIRRHIRKYFWLWWHEPEGRERRLRSLGLRGRRLKVAPGFRGAWHLAGTGSLQAALSNARLRRHGFLMPSDLARV